MSSKAGKQRFVVALLGFSGFEREALASFFRLAEQRTPAYVRGDDPAPADLLIADADHAGALAAVRDAERFRDTVFVGSRAPESAVAWLPRPIEPVRIVRELDALVGLRQALPDVPSEFLPFDRPLDTSFDEAAPAPGVDLLLPEVAPSFFAAAAERRAPAVLRAGGGGRPVLVVEDSAIARQFLKLRLQRLGYEPEVVATGEEALARIAARPFALVVADIVLGGPGSVDGLQVCQAVKRRVAALGSVRCPVILATGLDGSSDKVRGYLAGCDAYLTKPLLERDFIAALKLVDPAFEWGEDLAVAAS